MREAQVVSVPLPEMGGLVDVFAAHGQTYAREIQKDLVPRIKIAHSGYRWHNAVARNEMIQILRFLTFRKGGVYVHWDALAVRSQQLTSTGFPVAASTERSLMDSGVRARGDGAGLCVPRRSKIFCWLGCSRF